MNIDFNLTRLGHFMKRQLYMNLSAMWVALAAIIGVLLLISGIVAFSNPQAVANLVPFYLVVLFVGGYIFTSRIFSEMNTPQKSYAFMTLPVSTAEKIVGAWLIASPIYLLISIVSTLILTFASAQVAGQPANLPSLTDDYFVRTLGSFLVTQTVFFVGAATFKGNNFFKTLLAVIVIVAVVLGYTGGLGYLVLGGVHKNMQTPAEVKSTVEFIFKDLVPFLFWCVLGPYLLVVSYFKLRERQVV